MKPDLGLSDAVYGLGVGIFFLGYFVFEVPSNLILQRVGARVWIARIMLTWGVISACMMFVRTPASFYALRFLLGLAEAGFFPGMIYFLTQWFPAAQRAKAVSQFMTAIPLSGVLGGPLSGALLKLNGMGGLKGWQWVFLAEGLPSVLLGIVTLLYLTDRPAEARWLSSGEREWLMARLQREQAHREKQYDFTLWQAFAHPTILLLCAIYFAQAFCGYGVGFWTPLILKARSTWSAPVISVVTAVPSLLAVIVMLATAAHSDRHGDRRWHLAGAFWVGAAGIAASAWLRSPILTLAAFALASLGQLSSLGPFWALSTCVVSESTAAGAIAFINSVGNLGGFVGPTIMGALKQSTGGYTAGLSALAGALLFGGLLAVLVRHNPTLERTAAEVEAKPSLVGGASGSDS
jgi:ACS family tartrate transporter-like MFS transporter